MAINLVTKFQPYVDEAFTAGSKASMLTNKDFDWSGAHTIKIHKVNTVPMSDYDRAGTGENASRYGALGKVENTIEEMTLTKDRSFTFVIDTLDNDETDGVLSAAAALGRQQREVIIPEVDTYVYSVMTANAGTKVTSVTLTSNNLYDEIIQATETMDNNDVPDTGRILTVTPATYRLLKKCPDLDIDCDITADQKAKGVVGMIDGMDVVKLPAKRLPAKFGFMIAHPVATVAPTKLEEYRTHDNPPGISGKLVEGRIVYDAFVLDNKKMAIYYEENKPAE
ncbi:hypothetical protein [Coprococcus sp. B2-R-112]|uniref:hypothetical protein n=1 Tax=Coprococcus sp. B2-R-112 TaxID=2949662 RepID=UPI0020306630|nr:hypothetical protein [Coprococcus sp. B2-R-112]MCM0663473.1 hypothetical protein [Coprococcus sp. B2-R-112]